VNDPSRGPRLDLARSWRLVTPAELIEHGRPHSDIVIADLEDGTPAGLKDRQRDALADWFDGGNTAWIRINDATTTHWEADVSLAASVPGVEGVVLAKAESADEVAQTRAAIDAPLVPMVESARAVLRARSIAAAGAARIAFGAGDFRADLQIDDSPDALMLARSKLVLASRAEGLPGPIDGPTIGDDERRVVEDTLRVKALGMTGRLCVTRAQTHAVELALSPTRDEIASARRTLAATTLGYAGSAVTRQALARLTLERAIEFGLIRR